MRRQSQSPVRCRGSGRSAARLAVLVALVLGLSWLQMRTIERLAAIEQRLAGLEQRDAQQHDQIMQQFEALRRERGGGQP